MKKIVIMMLHLQHGGIEKQTITLANEFCKTHDVQIICTYSMRAQPAYPVNENVKIKYLIDDKPNRDEIKAAIKSKNIVGLLKQGVKAVKILFLKKYLMIKEVKNLDCDYILSTRIEFAEMLSAYAPENVVTMTQEHLHNGSAKYVSKAKKAFRNLDYLLVLCDGSRENFSRWLKDNKKIKIVQIPNILNEIPSESAPLCGNRLVSVGRLHPVKNFKALIEVFALVRKRLPEAQLTIVGGGDEYEPLCRQVKELGLENCVKITGMVSAEEVRAYMLSSDIYVMTSHTECFPMVLLEASSVGLPLISFDVPVGPRSIINNGENGYLVDYPDEEQMAEKIVHLLKDREELGKLGSNAKKASSMYLADNIMEKWYEIFMIDGEEKC